MGRGGGGHPRCLPPVRLLSNLEMGRNSTNLFSGKKTNVLNVLVLFLDVINSINTILEHILKRTQPPPYPVFSNAHATR